MGTRSCFPEKSGSERSSWPGRLAAPSDGCQPPPPAPPGPAADAYLPDRAWPVSTALPRVVVIYILSVYINLSAAALAALNSVSLSPVQPGTSPPTAGGCLQSWGGGESRAAEVAALPSNNKRLWRAPPPPGPRPQDAGRRCAGARGAGMEAQHLVAQFRPRDSAQAPLPVTAGTVSLVCCSPTPTTAFFGCIKLDHFGVSYRYRFPVLIMFSVSGGREGHAAGSGKGRIWEGLRRSRGEIVSESVHFPCSFHDEPGVEEFPHACRPRFLFRRRRPDPPSSRTRMVCPRGERVWPGWSQNVGFLLSLWHHTEIILFNPVAFNEAK